MSGKEGKEYIFLCPECQESLEVNESMKKTLTENGCVVCGTALTEAAFSEESFADSA